MVNSASRANATGGWSARGSACARAPPTGGSRADDDPVTGAVDALDLVDAGAIDNELGCVQAQTQNGEERLPSAEHLCVVAAGECGDRIIDVTMGAAKYLGFYQQGTTRVRVETIPAM